MLTAASTHGLPSVCGALPTRQSPGQELSIAAIMSWAARTTMSFCCFLSSSMSYLCSLGPAMASAKCKLELTRMLAS